MHDAWASAEGAVDRWAGPMARGYLSLFRTIEEDGKRRYAAEADWYSLTGLPTEPWPSGHLEHARHESTPTTALTALIIELGRDTHACDYCDEGLIRTRRGWHLREDPEGIEGTAKIPCARMRQYPDTMPMDP